MRHPVYNYYKLAEITSRYMIDTVVTHAPSFREPSTKPGFEKWAKNDNRLPEDATKERATLDQLFHTLKNNPYVQCWYYGHYHDSWQDYINGGMFRMLNTMEFAQLK